MTAILEPGQTVWVADDYIVVTDGIDYPIGWARARYLGVLNASRTSCIYRVSREGYDHRACPGVDLFITKHEGILLTALFSMQGWGDEL